MAVPLIATEPFVGAQVEESLQSKEFPMTKTILACACALLLSTGSVFAQAQQAQPAPGASSEGNVAPGATKGTTKHTSMKKGTTTGTSTGKMKAGSSSSSSPSSMDSAGSGTKK
jgi:hypothetical protein